MILVLAGFIAILIPQLLDRVAYESDGTGVLRVVFFDVGQGDAIFIESPTGKQVLIDGGPNSSVLDGLAREMGYFDRTLDVVVATHEDKDHIGGLPDVFDAYQVGAFVRTENQGESLEAHTIDDLSKREGSEIIYARRGMTFDLGSGEAGSTTLTVLFPDRDTSFLESNTSSIVLRLTYGNESFIFTGDSPDEIEEYLVSLDAQGLKSTVLKLGHHGSHTSSSEIFLRAVAPEYAIISAGKDNRYGHPHQEVLDRLKMLNIPYLSTAEVGDIIFESDGTDLREE